MKNKSTLWWGCIGVFVLTGLCLLVFSIYYFSQRARAFYSHPLVLIHNPVNHDRVQTGDGLVVHATARDNVGIQRMELWLDDQLIAAQDAPSPTNWPGNGFKFRFGCARKWSDGKSSV